MLRLDSQYYKLVGRLRLYIQLIPTSYDEILNYEATFKREIFRFGIVLYSRYVFIARLDAERL